MRPPILIVPGCGNSGPGHWQSLWQNSMPTASRVEMPNWDYPYRPDWVEALDAAVRRANETEPPVLVAHSLGCIAVAHWAAESRREVAGALLVAPTDVDLPQYRKRWESFAPVPRRRFLFDSRVVASSNDPFVNLARARQFAEAWGSRFTEVGDRGHLNLESGFGPWARGEALLEELING